MKKYTNKILIITLVVLAIAMSIVLTVEVRRVQKDMKENPDKYAPIEYRAEDKAPSTIVIDSSNVEKK